jgi:hypothetical protein
MLRAYSKLFHDPAMAALDTLLALILAEAGADIATEGAPELLFASHFVINKVLLLIDKLDYILVSYLTAMKNTKQRFRNQELCFAL